MANEKRFSTWLKDRLSDYAMVTKIETMTVSGVPDLHTIANGFDVWLECKSLDSDAVQMRASQWQWAKKYIEHHRGRYALVIQRPKLSSNSSKRPKTIIDVYLGTNLIAQKDLTPRGDQMVWDKNVIRPDFSFTQPTSHEVISDLARMLYTQFYNNPKALIH